MSGIEQLVMAHRFLYYVKCKPVISDREYDELEKEALKSAGAESPLHSPGSDLLGDYPTNVRAIAESFTTRKSKSPPMHKPEPKTEIIKAFLLANPTMPSRKSTASP